MTFAEGPAQFAAVVIGTELAESECKGFDKAAFLKCVGNPELTFRRDTMDFYASFAFPWLYRGKGAKPCNEVAVMMVGVPDSKPQTCET